MSSVSDLTDTDVTETVVHMGVLEVEELTSCIVATLPEGAELSTVRAKAGIDALLSLYSPPAPST